MFDPDANRGPRVGPNRRFVLVIVCLSMFVVELDITVVNIALPSIQRDLHFSSASLQWVVNTYLLVFGGLLLLAGRAADLLGRKRLFGFGLIVFAGGSALNALATSIPMMMVGRGFQGLGGAILTPTSLATLNTTFTDPVERSRALAVWTGIEVASTAVGLLLGGLITGALSWRWIFILNVFIAVAAFAGTIAYVPQSTAEDNCGSFDLAGSVCSTAGVLLLTYTLTSAHSWGWRSTRTIFFLLVSAAALALFIMVELRSRNPLVRLSIFRIRALTVGNVSFFLSTSGVFAMFYFSSIYVQEVLGYSPLQSGVALLPLTVGVLAGASAAQPLMQRLDLRTVAVGGLGIGVTGMLLLTRITASSGYLSTFLPGLFVLSIGLGLSMVPFTLLATSVVEEGEVGLASGLLTAVSSVGGALGLALLSSLAAARTHALLGGSALRLAGRAERLHAIVGGIHVAFDAGAGLLLLSAVLLAALLRRKDLPEVGRRTGKTA